MRQPDSLQLISLSISRLLTLCQSVTALLENFEVAEVRSVQAGRRLSAHHYTARSRAETVYTALQGFSSLRRG
ncbi:hypothetical protein BU26DRAFT_518580, partial [Trematosphaeria pertusa]